MATNKQPRPELPANMTATFAGALYRVCPGCGADHTSGFITSQKLCAPKGYRWKQVCNRCNRDFGTDEQIAATLTSAEAAA